MVLIIQTAMRGVVKGSGPNFELACQTAGLCEPWSKLLMSWLCRDFLGIMYPLGSSSKSATRLFIRSFDPGWGDVMAGTPGGPEN